MLLHLHKQLYAVLTFDMEPAQKNGWVTSIWFIEAWIKKMARDSCDPELLTERAVHIKFVSTREFLADNSTESTFGILSGLQTS